MIVIPKDIDLPIEGTYLRVAPDHLWLQSERALHVVSSACVGAELAYTRHVISMRVSLQYRSEAPEDDLREKASTIGIGEPFVGLLTAVDLSKAVVRVEAEQGLTMAAIVTVGIGNATAAGSRPAAGLTAGTINIVLLLEADLSPAAMINAVLTATEAKTLALVSAGVRTAREEPASGTSSDAIVVACTGRGPRLRYSGTATLAGWLIGRSVRQAVSSQLEEANK